MIEYADGEVCRGDVEVHRVASGWTAHRHHVDARYNNVMLHVILYNDRAATEISRADGQSVPQVVLTDWLSRPIETYRAEISLEDYPRQHAPRIGHCYTALRALPAAEIQNFLQRAGEVRLRQRAVRWSQRVEDVDCPKRCMKRVSDHLGQPDIVSPFKP